VPVDLEATREWATANRAAWEIAPQIETVRGEKRQTGYALTLYARIPIEIPPSEERTRAVLASWDRLCLIAQSLGDRCGEGARVEIDPFDAAGRLRPENRFEPEVCVNARIVHPGHYLDPAGPDERARLVPLEDRLRELGLRPGHW